MGPVDQWLRLSAGFVLLVLAGTGVIGAWGYLGVLPMLTATFRCCPLYRVLRLHRRRSNPDFRAAARDTAGDAGRYLVVVDSAREERPPSSPAPVLHHRRSPK